MAYIRFDGKDELVGLPFSGTREPGFFEEWPDAVVLRIYKTVLLGVFHRLLRYGAES